jgi:hypothetical protein
VKLQNSLAIKECFAPITVQVKSNIIGDVEVIPD